jgi:nucleotide-binding universal stress UspA family protein
MFPLSNILLPVDFSERCLGAARYAESLAAHFQAEIALIHVVEPLHYDFGELEFAGTVANDVLESRLAQARQQLDAFLASELAAARVSRVLVEGDPARCIVEYAHERQTGLIAMPTHGYGPFRRFILGSVTAKVLHDADCPVLTGVHLEEAPPLASIALRTILCALDLGPQSRKTLSWASQMASEFGARLVLAHAIPSIEARPGDYFDAGLTAEVTKGARLGCGPVRPPPHQRLCHHPPEPLPRGERVGSVTGVHRARPVAACAHRAGAGRPALPR